MQPNKCRWFWRAVHLQKKVQFVWCWGKQTRYSPMLSLPYIPRSCYYKDLHRLREKVTFNHFQLPKLLYVTEKADHLLVNTTCRGRKEASGLGGRSEGKAETHIVSCGLLTTEQEVWVVKLVGCQLIYVYNSVIQTLWFLNLLIRQVSYYSGFKGGMNIPMEVQILWNTLNYIIGSGERFLRGPNLTWQSKSADMLAVNHSPEKTIRAT